MNYHQTDAPSRGAIHFTGNWRDYLPIAATNVLLIVVTLGIYRFWAAARQRRYLWSHTRIIDDTLDWTGTGKEMFLGFLMVMAIFLPIFLLIQFLLPALIARGQGLAAAAVALAFYVGVFWLIGLARFRALRYRLSRSWWHGIRGGSDDSGVAYANESLVRGFLTFVTAFLIFPMTQTRLWNARWNAMSFGPRRFEASLSSEGLWRRWLFLYVLPLLLILAMVALLAVGAGAAVMGGGSDAPPGLTLIAIVIAIVAYLAIPLATLHWYAKFFRQAADALTLGDLRFGFTARTRDWLMLFLGNIALAGVTLGFGMAYWGYRNWSFLVRHAHLYGEVDLAALTQSSTAAPRESEGFADAFDMGAI